ncbi:MAG: iron ABC transporter permease [Solobacterium sp.]|nr:iron ABC transporter permease [Solobacterium sp.]
MKQARLYRLCMIAAIVCTAAFALAALCMGRYTIPLAEVFKEFFGGGSEMANVHTVLFQIRIPRILLSILAGAGLAASGCAFQSLFGNPLATPDTLGIANGASFGAAAGILLGLQAIGVQTCALAAGLLAVVLVFAVTGGKRSSMIMVVLAGMVISSLFSALVSLVKYVADPQDVLPVITFWLMGSLSSVTVKSLLYGAPFILTGIIILYLLRYRLNVLSLAEDEARALGVDLRLLRGLVIAASASITASVVALCGVIGWVGLLVPHIARMLFGNSNARILPASLVFGGLFLLCVDTAARCIAAAEIPVSILTAVIGAPVFILLLRKTGGIQA